MPRKHQKLFSGSMKWVSNIYCLSAGDILSIDVTVFLLSLKLSKKYDIPSLLLTTHVIGIIIKKRHTIWNFFLFYLYLWFCFKRSMKGCLFLATLSRIQFISRQIICRELAGAIEVIRNMQPAGRLACIE